MPRTWSRDSLPIVIKGDLRRIWGILAIVWAVALVPAGWWLLWHPESGSRALPLALIILVALPIGAANRLASKGLSDPVPRDRGRRRDRERSQG